MKTEAKYLMTVNLTDNRRSTHKFHTIKSARHYAKSLCENNNVVSIKLSGDGLPQTTLFFAPTQRGLRAELSDEYKIEAKFKNKSSVFSGS